MKRKFPELRKAIEKAHSIELPLPRSRTYNFKVYAFGERGTKISPELMKETVSGLCDSIKENFLDFDYLVAPEPNGHVWASLVAYELGKPLNILRRQPVCEEGELEVPRKTSYYQDSLYFNSPSQSLYISFIQRRISREVRGCCKSKIFCF